jgi:hypothetical protein
MNKMKPTYDSKQIYAILHDSSKPNNVSLWNDLLRSLPAKYGRPIRKSIDLIASSDIEDDAIKECASFFEDVVAQVLDPNLLVFLGKDYMPQFLEAISHKIIDIKTHTKKGIWYVCDLRNDVKWMMGKYAESEELARLNPTKQLKQLDIFAYTLPTILKEARWKEEYFAVRSLADISAYANEHYILPALRMKPPEAFWKDLGTRIDHMEKHHTFEDLDNRVAYENRNTFKTDYSYKCSLGAAHYIVGYIEMNLLSKKKRHNNSQNV